MEAKFDRHSCEVRDAYLTMEFDVKSPRIPLQVTEELMRFEMETGNFVSKYAERCYREIKKGGYKWLTGWCLAGRSGGWFVLKCRCDRRDIRPETIARITEIVERYYKCYGRELLTHYGIK